MKLPIDRIVDRALVHKLVPRPKPQTFCLNHPIDAAELRMRMRLGEPRERVILSLRRFMVQRLAEHLEANCKTFQFDFDRLMRDEVLRMEVTIDDRGTYEGMVDGAERAGHRAGIKDAIEAMPYGLNEVYE